jgi:hypothetical protein
MLWHDLILPLILSTWPYLLVLFLIVVGGVILQILMMRVGGYGNRLSSGFNALVGSLTNAIFLGLILLVAYSIWGTQVVDETWFALIEALAFSATWIFLRAIGFWYR